MISAIKKNECLGKLGAHLPRQASLPVVHAIVEHVDPILGVASEGYKHYAEVSATGQRTVQRTIPALYRHGLLRKQSRRDGPPVLWLPELMDMQADEAVRRAGWLADHKYEDPKNYFRAGNGKVADCALARGASERARGGIDGQSEPATNTFVPSPETQLESREHRTKPKPSTLENDLEILSLIHSQWDAQGLTPEDPEALTKAIHAAGNSRPARFRTLDKRALRKAFQRARGRLPAGYDRWIGLVEKWDKSYDRQQARNLVDRLVTGIGDRPRGNLDRMFAHLERQICDYLPRKVRRLEYECEQLEKDEYYIPQFRSLKRDNSKDRVYAALTDGPKTIEQLTRMFGKTYDAISAVGLRLRKEGLITRIWHEGQFMWARTSTAPLFIPARDAIVAALEKGPMTVPDLAQAIGKGTSTVKCALHRHLLKNGTVIRTKFGIYALADTQPPYVSRAEAILAALKNGPMTFQALAREIDNPTSSLPQFLEPLLEKDKVIRTARGVYALAGTAPVYVPTSDAIISALTKKAMKLGPLIHQVNKLTKTTRSQSTIRTVLSRLKEEGKVKQDRPLGEYRLARSVRAR